MKKFLPLAALALVLTACNESKDEFHQQYFYPQMVGGMAFFADQATDTITFVSTDPWTARSTADWFSVSPTSFEIPSGYLQIGKPIVVTATPNTTGNIRQGVIEVSAYESTLTMKVTQYPWLNIQYPAPERKQDAEGMSDAEAVRFSLTLLATSTGVPLNFVTYEPGATLTSDADWITIPDTLFAPGAHTYKPAIKENASMQPRKATLTLTSGGFSNQILITQEGRTEN